MKSVIFIVLFILLSSLSYSQIPIITSDNTALDNDLEYLASFMQGSFSSQEQSLKDTTYFDIRLHMQRMWTDRTDAAYLYVEQAVSTSIDKPYRQRVYRLTKINEKTFESAVFTFSDPLKYAGDWTKDNPLSDLTSDNLIQRKGCSVFLTKNDNGSFSGSTNKNDCESDLKNAKYATSEVKIDKDGLISWDRGFNEKDEQVWGATKGGYIFKRVRD